MEPRSRVLASRIALVAGVIALVLAFAIPNLLALRLRAAQAEAPPPADGEQSSVLSAGDDPVARRDAR